MSGFVPAHYGVWPEIVAALGVDVVGRLLAGGSFRAHALDAGRLIPLDRAIWMKSGAREVVEAGELPPTPSGHRSWGEVFLSTSDAAVPLYITVEDANGRLAILNALDDGAGAGPGPAWHPEPGETITAWVNRSEPEAEAQHRLVAAGVALSEGRLVGALETMWRETGRTVSEDTIGGLRRRARRTG